VDKIDSATHLEIASPDNITTNLSLNEQILDLLRQKDKPMTRTTIRKHLKCNNQRLGKSLLELDKQGLILRTSSGWVNIQSHGLNRQTNTENFILTKTQIVPFL